MMASSRWRSSGKTAHGARRRLRGCASAPFELPLELDRRCTVMRSVAPPIWRKTNNSSTHHKRVVYVSPTRTRSSRILRVDRQR